MGRRSKKAKATSADKPRALQPEPWLWALILFVGVVLVYSPVWWAGYIWDDEMFVSTNPVIIGPLGVKEIWTTAAADVCPLTLTLFWLIHPIFGLAPFPYHLISVLLHGVCAIVLWRVLLALRIPGAWLGAAIWAFHPVNVESVAWIAETKNTLSGLFYLLAALFFVKGLKPDESIRRDVSSRNYALTLLFAALAMAGKSSTVILPLVLCLCAWWMDGRWNWRSLVKTAPIFFFSICAGLASMWTQKFQLAAIHDTSWHLGVLERLAIAGDAIWFYLGKLLWPGPLMIIYPRWQIDAGSWISCLPLLAVVVVSIVLWFKRESWARSWFFAWTYFIIALLPVLGLFDNFFSRYSFVADHFQYLADMGPLALAGAGIVRFLELLFTGRKWVLPTVGALTMLVLGVVSWNRAWVFESSETIWADAIAKNPACWVGYNNLGNVLSKKGDIDAAIAAYGKALEVHPSYAEAESNLGDAMLHKGQTNEAIADYQKALEINPNYADAHYNLGVALQQAGEIDRALDQFQKTLGINPLFAGAYYNIGFVLYHQGKVDDAIAAFQKAIAIRPDYSDARNNLAIALVGKGRVDDATAQFEEILRYDPGNAIAQDNLAKAQAMRQKPLEAK